MDGDTSGLCAKRLPQNLFSLEVPAIGQIDIRFGHRVHIVRHQLTWGIDHGGGRPVTVMGVHTLATACSKERFRLETTFHKGAIDMLFVLALSHSVDAQSG